MQFLTGLRDAGMLHISFGCPPLVAEATDNAVMKRMMVMVRNMIMAGTITVLLPSSGEEPAAENVPTVTQDGIVEAEEIEQLALEGTILLIVPLIVLHDVL
jgi:hypothetical protein